jgi:hypothetical protein
MSDNRTRAAEVLAELTDEPVESFAYDGPMPSLDELDVIEPDEHSETFK